MLVQILSFLLALIAARVLSRRWKYDLHKIPSPPGLPLLGHTLEFFCGQPRYQLSQWLGRVLRQMGYPKLMRVDVAGCSCLVISDMHFIKEVINSKTASFPRFFPAEESIRLMIGNDPKAKIPVSSVLPGPFVNAIRRVYTTAFSSRNLKLAMPKMNKVFERAIDIIESNREKGPIDLQSLFVKMAMDVIGAVALDSNLGGLDGSRDIHTLLLQAGYILRGRFTRPLTTLQCKLFPKCAEAQRQRKIIDSLATEWERLAREILNRENPPEGEEPFWSLLRDMKDPDTNEPLQFASILALVGGAVVAGSDSTGHQIGWLFALLASHPRVAQKLLDELREKGLHGPDARDAAFEDIGELPYLAAVVKEGMRIAYIGSLSLMRYVPRDMTIFGYRIPKGTIVVSPGTRSMDSEEMWGDPRVFRPERWLTEEDMSHKYFLGFSYGPRDCSGQKLAMLEMRLVIIKLLTRYTFSPTMKLEELLKNAKEGLVIEAREGVWLNVSPRDPQI